MTNNQGDITIIDNGIEIGKIYDHDISFLKI